jgi:hypothetical protein
MSVAPPFGISNGFFWCGIHSSLRQFLRDLGDLSVQLKILWGWFRSERARSHLYPVLAIHQLPQPSNKQQQFQFPSFLRRPVLQELCGFGVDFNVSSSQFPLVAIGVPIMIGLSGWVGINWICCHYYCTPVS